MHIENENVFVMKSNRLFVYSYTFRVPLFIIFPLNDLFCDMCKGFSMKNAFICHACVLVVFWNFNQYFIHATSLLGILLSARCHLHDGQ